MPVGALSFIYIISLLFFPVNGIKMLSVMHYKCKKNMIIPFTNMPIYSKIEL